MVPLIQRMIVVECFEWGLLDEAYFFLDTDVMSDPGGKEKPLQRRTTPSYMYMFVYFDGVS